MSFDSLRYLVFLPVVALAHRLCPQRARWALLLAASVVFYASWNAALTLLLLAVIGVAWLAGLAIGAAPMAARKRRALILALSLCAGLLGYFKYFNFLAGSAAGLLRAFGADAPFEPWDIVLPIGISFYTFQAMSYVIDVYRGAPPERHFGYFALYVCFFPQLVAGPIERADALLPQLRAARRAEGDDLRAGLRMLLAGFFGKLAIADACGRAVDAVYAAPLPDGSAVLVATILFAFQIYCDFAGYSLIARGSARLMGIRLMRNFDAPYLARDIREFWRRWHISLSRWLTDYLYIPLGGSRRGAARRALATVAVFLVSGLWHGANWTFVAWGLYHALLMLLLLALRGRPLPAGRLITFAAVCFGWIFFRAESLSRAGLLIGRIFSRWDVGAGIAALGLDAPAALALGLGLFQLPLLRRLSADDAPPPGDMTCVYLLLATALSWLIRLDQGGRSAFIYFQF